ncbi:hypothetical protein ABPG72_021667 [Tetrahymena utriculariae]
MININKLSSKNTLKRKFQFYFKNHYFYLFFKSYNKLYKNLQKKIKNIKIIYFKTSHKVFILPDFLSHYSLLLKIYQTNSLTCLNEPTLLISAQARNKSQNILHKDAFNYEQSDAIKVIYFQLKIYLI